MAGILDQIQQDQQAGLEREVGAAKHDADWAGFFNSTPTSEVLRKQRDFTSLVGTAIENKQRLLAQTDANAADIYYKQKKFEDFQRQAPMRDELLRSRIDHENAMTEASGAAERYKMTKDAETANQVSSFYTRLSDIKAAPGTQEYHDAVVKLAAAHPLAIMTPEVGADLKTITKVHTSINDLMKNIPEGFLPGRMHQNAAGDTSIDIVPKGKLFDTLTDAMDAIPSASAKDFRQTKNGFEYVPKADKGVSPSLIKLHATLIAMSVSPQGDTPEQKRANQRASQEALADLEENYPDLGKKQDGGDAAPADAQADPQDSGDQFEVGKVYTDAAGNKATYKGDGQWEE